MSETEVKQLRDERKDLIDKAAICEWHEMGAIADRIDTINALLKAAGEDPYFDPEEAERAGMWNEGRGA